MRQLCVLPASSRRAFLRIASEREQRTPLCFFFHPFFPHTTDGNEAKRPYERGRTHKEPEGGQPTQDRAAGRMEMYPTVRSRFKAVSAYSF